MAFPRKSAKSARDPNVPVKTPKGWLHRYNVLDVAPINEWQLELNCWRHRLETGMGSYYHLRRAAELLMPASEWHPWREERFRALCDEELVYKLGGVRVTNISMVGCGASGKTQDAATFGFLFWLAAPHESFVVLTSTSKTKMRQRAWPVIQECFNSARNVMDLDGTIGPHMLNSQMELQSEPGDHKHAIFGQAIEAGEVDKAVQNIRGVHANRICLIIDEADGTPDAIYATIPNMLKGCREFVIINSSNGPMTHLDTFSRVCEPVRGWSSVSVDTPRWATKAVPEFQLPPGTCLHFDGKTSPNVLAGKTLYPYLYTHENWQRVADNPDVQNTVQFWSQERGFWPPAGFSNTVFSEALVESHGGRDRDVVWIEQPQPVAAFDPAFGGDDCVLQMGLLGMAAGRKRVLLLTETLLVPFDPSSTEPIDVQIGRLVMEKCKRAGVIPELFGTDSTGTGRGVAALLKDRWSPDIVTVEFGGGASELPASPSDPRPSNEVFSNRVTELWWSAREMLQHDQLKGLGDDAIKQFCSRLYEYKAKKYRVERKDETKARTGRSPDQADAVTVLVDVCRRNGQLIVAEKAAGSGGRQSSWSKLTAEVATLATGGYDEGQTFAEFVTID